MKRDEIHPPLPCDAVLPCYGEGGLLGLIDRFAAFLDGRPWVAPGSEVPQEDARVVVFLLIDGLGDNYLQRSGAGSALLAHRRGRLTSVFPSTTASAVTTTMTGLAPARHGLTGWHIRDRRFGGILAPLPLVRRGGDALAALRLTQRLFPYRTLYQRRARRSIFVSPRSIAWSRYSLRHARGARIRGYGGAAEGMGEAVVRAVRELGPEGGFVHAYYPLFDTLSHEFGSSSDAAHAEFRRIDRVFGELLGRLAGQGCAIVVSADHGFCDASDERTVHLDDYPELSGMLECPLFGERRAAFCAVRRAREAEFEAAAREAFAGKAVVARSPDLVAAGLFGTGPFSSRLAERTGSHVLLMEPGWTVVDRVAGETPHAMIGVHGGLSPDEMWIPLVTGYC
ncbi:alkaline phosphatase family protein [Pseudazoarcus pumilus]|uniref:Phosphodiesterase n=1 Tax=Pseudazoarcus pumilus TaxID=2067960 RepID=A0A2I6S7Q7_9RHOO|nr:alkaline phosphatase family protein [Pseudazoarcus pumilus]AUN95294.1 phosphodiesterase [Pseudazoarcus pumilus]